MDWDSITQTGARASGVEESTPRMAVCCKSRVLPQHTQPVAQILNPVLNPVYFARIAAFLLDRKSTRLNSSHANISYAVFCLKKKNRKSRSRPCRSQTNSSSLETKLILV